jgi:predicted metal-dependent HD superfamily phosphohydrolase
MPSLFQKKQEELGKLLTAHGLTKLYEWFVATNPSNDLPYHNLYHAQCLTLNCAKAASSASLTENETRTLLVAALFHDAGHSGGRLQDAENIQVAVTMLASAAQAQLVDPATLSIATRLIRATEFPHARDGVDELERIIQDADLFQAAEDSWFEQVYVGLRKELEHNRGPLSLLQFCELQEPFVNAIHFQSKWGREQEASFRRKVARRLDMAISHALATEDMPH